MLSLLQFKFVPEDFENHRGFHVRERSGLGFDLTYGNRVNCPPFELKLLGNVNDLQTEFRA